MYFLWSHQWGFHWKPIKISHVNFKWTYLGAQMDFGGVLELGYKYFRPSESIAHVSGTVRALQISELSSVFSPKLSNTPGLRGSTL